MTETTGFDLREVTVARLGLRGEGLADGLRVPFALPGERVRGPAADGVLAPLTLVEPSPDRVAPPCPQFEACGGCALQHASDGFLAAWKREVVARALAARRIDAEVAPTLVSPARSRRRAVFAARRTKRTLMIGFHGRRSETVADAAGCLVVRPELLGARPALAAVTALGASRAHGLRLTVTHGMAGLDVEAAGGKPLDADLRARLAAVAEAHDLARLAWEGAPVAARRPPWQAFGRARVVPPPGAFLQATAEGEAALVAAVRAGTRDARRVADLFAGCGTFALPLAEAAEVHVVEGDAAMLDALAAGWRAAPGLRRVTTEARDLFRRPLSPAELDRFDAAVFDPPRAGAEAQARALAASRVPRVVAVSCNPITFARDAAILVAGGFRLGPVRPVDQFRWSGHVEIVAAFTRWQGRPPRPQPPANPATRTPRADYASESRSAAQAAASRTAGSASRVSRRAAGSSAASPELPIA
jgi:23S rRNA (uracil1939-C5)-methyltransferase